MLATFAPAMRLAAPRTIGVGATLVLVVVSDEGEKQTADEGRLADLSLLRERAPILRFDERELFFPTAVDGYVEAASLHLGETTLVPEGEVALSDLDHRLGPDVHLRFISDLDRRSVVKDDLKRLARRLLTPRLGRVGIFGRILDALFLLTGLVRPLTPRRTTPAAALKSERLDLHTAPVVYGRVIRDGEWTVLHYAYFYLMNDWRSGYRGLNDHEADWEQAWLFCDPETLQPAWVVASSHDHIGADLRRAWSDPELMKSGGRPMLFPGAGSHALYFRPGDYVTRLDVPALRWLLRLQSWSRRALRIRDEATERGLGPAFGAPFVDSATADGREIRQWDVRELDENVPWVGSYRGLWGLDTGDPAGGERGPSGPKFNRRGEVRVAWADPTGFAGLHGTPPVSAIDKRVSVAKLQQAIDDIDADIRRIANLLPLAQLTPNPEMADESVRLTGLLRQRSELVDLHRLVAAGRIGEPLQPRAHLKHPATALPPPRDAGFVLAGWAASSIPLMLIAVAAVILFERLAFAWLPIVVGAMATIGEQLARRHFQAVLRLLALYILVAAFFLFVIGGAITVSRYALGVLFAVAGAVLLIANLGELRAVQYYRSRSAEMGQGEKPEEQYLEPPVPVAEPLSAQDEATLDTELSTKD